MTDNLYVHPQADDLLLALSNRRQLQRHLLSSRIDRDVFVCTFLLIAAVAVGGLFGRRR